MTKKTTSERLQRYREKRDFAVTSEPSPEVPARLPADRPTFMVHKHDATRLHYDLRLEMDGVLASWAIPKGPTYDPDVKRLAVETEDHPLAYGSFEGRIPDGEYGAGDSIIWDRGTYDTVPPGQASAQRQKGHLHLELFGEKLRGRWHLVRTRPQRGKAQWICFKAKDGLERKGFDVVAERPESVLSGRRVTRGPVTRASLRAPHPAPEVLLERVWPPMNATLAQRPDARERYVYEVKYDGYRGLAAISGGRVAFQSRNAIDFTERFPQLAAALRRLRVGEAVLDGEVVGLDKDGVSHFQLIQEPAAEHRFVVFDLLWLEGHDLREQPLEERRELLESLMANVPRPLELAQRIDLPLADALAAVRHMRMEGLMAKRRGSKYVGARSRDWLKLKVSTAQEVAIVGYTPISSGKEEIGALLLGLWEKGRFVFAGKVGTGFDAKTRKGLFARLERDRVDKPQVTGAPRFRDARWVKPKLVAQVAFGDWTRDGKLRHPSFQGLREDKSPKDCVREMPKEQNGPPRHVVKLTSADKKLFPQSGITKGEMVAYYREVAPVLVPALDQRPLVFEQWPRGISHPGIYRQGVKGQPAWATTADVVHNSKSVKHLVVDRPETLEWIANQNAITLHAWHSHLPMLDEPDWVLFDLDPPDSDPNAWKKLVRIANALRGMLEELSIESVPKTSGKRGLHVLVPLARGHTYEDALNFAIAVTATLERGLPSLATTERALSKRRGRLYLDAMQNGRGKTVVAPYSLRAVEGATFSAPLQWSEVTESLDPKAFNLRTAAERLDQVGDLFRHALEGRQRLPRFASS